jgi:hypothetical protein
VGGTAPHFEVCTLPSLPAPSCPTDFIIFFFFLAAKPQSGNLKKKTPKEKQSFFGASRFVQSSV